MSISQAAGGFYEANAVNQATLSVTPVTVGNFLLFGVKISSLTPTVTGVSGGGVTVWNKIIGVTDATNAGRSEIWGGVITATGAATITATYSATPGVSCDLWGTELVWSGGKPTKWSAVASGTQANTSGTVTITYPSLTSSSAFDQAYWGFSRSGPGQTPAAGATSGFTYSTASTASGMALFNGTLATSTAFQPTESSNSSLTFSFTIAVIIQASVTSPVATQLNQSVARLATR